MVKNDISNCLMRDVLLQLLYRRMRVDPKIFFLSADFGSPVLDRLRRDFPKRFVNVGIAEQNLINISAGLCLEGFSVYAYAIAPFLTMRAYEQIRINLSLMGQVKEMNLNLIGVGAGLSYDVSGPTHHCLEDLSIMRALPNIAVFSPSDCSLVERFFNEYSLKVKGVKYLRLDGKPADLIKRGDGKVNIEDGFRRLSAGREVCLVSTGYMTHTALKAMSLSRKNGVHPGLIDVFMLRPLNEKALLKELRKYKAVLVLEEAFSGRGGVDSLVLSLLAEGPGGIKVKSMGFKEGYDFRVGRREYLHALNGLDPESVADNILKLARGIE